jgi:hypothetical protein
MKCAMLAGLLVTGLSVSALADTDVFLNAVAFALTGNDTANVQAFDRANCVFMLNAKNIGGHLGGEVFHLNNVDIDRLTFQPWENVAGKWIEVALHGETTVYEYTGTYTIDPNNPVVTAEQQKVLQEMEKPESSSSFVIKIYSGERDRLMRAWKYIYSHGCKGKKSSF